MLLMIDNYDSFTYNLVQYFGELGQDVQVYRNDCISIEQIKELAPQYIVISPGPCSPSQAGISVAVVEQLGDQYPILGVCLGHQSIGQAFGAAIGSAKSLMHGKTSLIYHNGEGVFKDLEIPFLATRYHSLVIERDTVSSELEITAWTDDDEIMAVRHKTLAIHGVQFHPESIATEHGMTLLNNFITQGVKQNN